MFSHKNIYFYFILISLLFSGCVERDRLNPIDPENPETGGRPEGLRIYSELQTATLSWNHVEVNNFVGYKIYKKTENDTIFKHIYTTPQDSNIFIDKGLEYELKYSYQISVLADDFESDRSDSVTIIPGPTTIWVGDVYGRRITKLSHDCAHEITSITLDAYPWSFVMEEKTNQLWFSDVLLDRIYWYENNQYHIFAKLEDAEPIKIKSDQNNNRLWIADAFQNRLIVYNLNRAKLKEIDGFTKLSDFDVDLNTGSCLVLDAEDGYIRRITKDFNIDWEINSLAYPTHVAINQTTGEFWVIDSYEVVKFSSTGEEILRLDHRFNLPKSIAVDNETGNCWVADWFYEVSASKLFCFSSQGDNRFEISNLNWPENIQINAYDNSCIVADSGNGRFLKIASDGSVYGSIENFDYAYGIAIEY